MALRIIATLLILACATLSARADDVPLSLNVFRTETKAGPAKGWRQVQLRIEMKNSSTQAITVNLLHLSVVGANRQRYFALRVVPAQRFQVTVPANGTTGFDVPRVLFNIPSPVAITHLDLLGPGQKPLIHQKLSLPASR